MINYQEIFSTFVTDKLRPFYNAIKPFYLERSNGQNADSLSYFRAHYPRFEAMIDLIEKNVKTDTRAICELGSFYPYTSHALAYDSIDLYDIMPRVCGTTGYSVEDVTLTDFNLCTDEFPGNKWYDLIIMSEVIEHLPISLFKLQDKVTALLKKGGYLLVTYPLGGFNAQDYDKDYGEHDRLRHEHLREFTEETIPLFFKSLKIIDSAYVDYPAYGKIKLVLYQNA